MTPERRREVGREYYYRQQEKKGKTPVKGMYGLLQKMSKEEYKAYRALQMKEWQRKTKDTKSAEYIEKRKAYQRDLYRRRKEEGYTPPVKYTAEELKERKHEYYMRVKHKENHPREIEAMPIEEVLIKKEELLKVAKRRVKRRLPKPKPVKVVKVKVVKEKPAPKVKSKPAPKIPVIRKPKPKEEKPKPEVLPTLVRDESEFVSVRIDAKTSLWVHRDRVEEAKANYVAKMLQGGVVK